MIVSIAHSIKAVTFAAILGIGLAASANAKDENSGFLKDYSQLKTEKDPMGNERQIWVSPKFTGANYKQVLLDAVEFYPPPKPSETVPESTLKDLRAYIDSEMRKAIASVAPPATAPGPGVVRIREAITAVGTASDFKAYQLIPVALVATTAKSAAGKSKVNVKLFVEAEVTDSVSGEPLARFVREAQGVQIGNKDVLTLQAAKPQIDQWSQAVQQFLAARLK